MTQRTTKQPRIQLQLWLKGVIVSGSLFLACLSPAIAFAGAFRIFDQSASATAQGGAFAAQADDPSAIFFNPAGLTQLRGIQTSFGVMLIGGHTTYTSPTGATTRGNFDGSIAVPPPINVYFSANLKDLGFSALGDLSAGLGIVSPFGILYRYPDDGPFSTAVTKQALPLIDIKPTLAYKLSDQLSVGVGADIYTFASFWGSGQSVTKFNSSGGPGLPPPGTRMEVNGGDTAAGFNVSLLYTPFRNEDGKPLANVALIYRSQATLHLDGNFLANGGLVTDASTTLVLPQVFAGGISIWPIRDRTHEWKLELDVDMTGWKSVRNTDVHLSNGTTIPFAQNWRNSYTTMIGTEYKWLRPERLPAWEVALRAGYWHSQTPIPDSSFLPTVPDADQHAISVGLGFLCKDDGRFLGLVECANTEGKAMRPKAIGLDLAYQAIFYETRTISGNLNPVAIPGVVNGTYQTSFHVGMINFRVNF
ncbi:MAG: putative Porin [Nitrospira sp.]|nr:putative Porin [Nitrospira sp.]